MNDAHLLKEKNYARNAELLPEEITDFSTMFPHPTGINRDRMRLPTRYDIAKFYKRNKTPSSYDEAGNPRYEKGRWMRKAPEDIPEFTSMDFNWQITYSFPSDVHPNITPIGKAYGAKNMTFRRLYLILCERFNSHVYFIDHYFEEIYPTSWVKEEVDVALNNAKNELLMYVDSMTEGARVTKRGTLDRRQKNYKQYAKSLDEWSDFARTWEENVGADLADKISYDIQTRLENGELGLIKTGLESSTKARRRYAGVPTDDTVFYAMGELINSLQLYIKLGGTGKWKSDAGIVV